VCVLIHVYSFISVFLYVFDRVYVCGFGWLVRDACACVCACVCVCVCLCVSVFACVLAVA
jgi:hypothetical protein